MNGEFEPFIVFIITCSYSICRRDVISTPIVFLQLGANFTDIDIIVFEAEAATDFKD